MRANVLQSSGAVCLVLFLFAIWPPLALLGTGAFLLFAGLALEKPAAKALEGGI